MKKKRFLSDVKFQDLKVNLKQPKTTLNNLKQPKKQLKVQYIGIFEEIDSFY